MLFDEKDWEKRDVVVDLLGRARERVSKPGGWHQGYYKCGDAVCVSGAIYEEEFEMELVVLLALNALQKSLPRGFVLIDHYNDTSGRKQSEIIDLFDRAIARREAELRANTAIPHPVTERVTA